MQYISAKLDYLDLIPGGRTEVGDMNIGVWLRPSTDQAPLWLLFPEIIDLNTIDFRTSDV